MDVLHGPDHVRDYILPPRGRTPLAKDLPSELRGLVVPMYRSSVSGGERVDATFHMCEPVLEEPIDLVWS